MIKRCLVILLAVLLPALPLVAQFYNAGNEPGRLRWYQLTTQDYKIVYPKGLDSLARVYAASLETVKGPVGATAGYTPNQLYKKQLPVILHPWTANANGMVAWTPRRMELYTTPDFSAPLPMPWVLHLTAHESRHVSQMQFGYEKPYKFWNILLGQLFQGAMDVMYCGPAFYEGDAVVAETELSNSGRGRNSAFLEYYRAAFREGDTRDWWKWRYGSLKKFTPDHYTLGYVTMAGMRSVYDAPDFTARYYQRLFARKCWPFPLFNFNKTVKDVSGKRFKDSFAEITDTLQQRWSRDAAIRAPFMEAELLTPAGRHYLDYSKTCVHNGQLYSVRTGTTRSPELVRIDSSAKVSTVCPFAYSTSQLKEDAANSRIWWSEIVSDTRWEMVSYSEVWFMDAAEVRHRLKPHTRWYNPSVSADGLKLAVTEYAWNGEASVLVLDPLFGTELERYKAPAGMQPVETEWVGDQLYACAITENGQGIYSVQDGYRQLLDCGSNVVKQLFVHDGALCFVSDLNGVDELYSFVPGAEAVYRISNTPVGSSSFCFANDGTLVYSSLTKDGRFINTTKKELLPEPQKVDFSLRHKYEFAEELTATGPGVVQQKEITLDSPKPYSKLANAFRIHSWAPVYVNYNAIDDLSFESLTSSAGLGAVAFFQNELSNLEGTVAYNASYSDHWTHLAETKITYKGLYPVIEGSFSISTDAPQWYFLHRYFKNFSRILSLGHEDLDGLPSFNASILMYVPLSFSSGGWYRGVVPQVRWSLSNSIITCGKSFPMNRLSASVRGYVVKATPESCIYPKLGLGAELGWSGRPGAMSIFTSNAYVYSYAYLPGFMDTHGIKITAIAQTPMGEATFGERYAAVMPRGMGEYSDLSSQTTGYPIQSRVTLDYAFPFAPLDWSGLGPVAYVRNLECTLHGDYAYFGGSEKKHAMNIGGAGAELCVVLGNFLWIPYDTRIGVKYYYNLGIPKDLNPHQFDMVFTVDL